ncbi:uncharacterized protein LOC143624915 [Bidens hawaiensis]|uniref:uncharacterized protein LOC143624915 n=1 Tax=Bidens hawaiensis TaxID=980011 RepID=UPI00404B8437
MLIKYLFKYISKGTDRIRYRISKGPLNSDNASTTNDCHIDEIQNFVDSRFICPHEASWRIFNFPIHCRNPAVQVLSVHQEHMQTITFRDSDNLANVLSNPTVGHTTLTGWLHNNRHDDRGLELRYIDYVSEYRWDTSGKCWIRRSYNTKPAIGRLTYVHPSCGERFYLRMLLTHQRGCRTFKDIRTVEGHVCSTYRDACDRLGLLGDDREWSNAFNDAAAWGTASELRTLFTHMLLYCSVSKPIDLWNEQWEKMADDIRLRHGITNPEDLKQQILYEIELLLCAAPTPSTLSQYGLPLPNEQHLALLSNRLLMEEKNYDRQALAAEHTDSKGRLNGQQRDIYEHVMTTLALNEQVLAFVYGHGGTGKTFLWSTIASGLRSQGKIVLAVAASGIASLLLPAGRTAHSRFRIPIDLSDDTTCDIKKNTQLGQLLTEATLIIWDEAPMNNRKCFEALDRSLKRSS